MTSCLKVICLIRKEEVETEINENPLTPILAAKLHILVHVCVPLRVYPKPPLVRKAFLGPLMMQ